MGRGTKVLKRSRAVDCDPEEFIRAKVLWPLLCDLFGVDEAREKLIEAYNTGTVESVRLIVPRTRYVWPPSVHGVIWHSAEHNRPDFCRKHELLFPSSFLDEVRFRWDGLRAYDFADVNKTFLKGYTQRDLVNEALRVMKQQDGVEEGAISGLSERPSARGFLWAGLARDLMNYVATKNDASWAIKDRKLHLIPGRRPGDPVDTTPKWELLFSAKDASRLWPQLKMLERVEEVAKGRPGRKPEFNYARLKTLTMRILHDEDAGKAGTLPNYSRYVRTLLERCAQNWPSERQPSFERLRSQMPTWHREFLDTE